MLKSHISRVAGFFHSNPNRWLAAASLAILAALASTLASLGANDAFRPQPKRSQTPATKTSAQANKTYTMYSGLWRTDGGFVSTIRIKNVLVVAPMDVTPVLFMADGTPYLLPYVHLAVSGVATININDALATAPSIIASHISQFGSVALIHSYSSPGHVSASMAVIDASRSLSYTFPFAEPMGDPMEQTLEGLWWKHDPGVSGWIALSNVSDAGKQVNVQLAGPGNDSQPARTVDLAAHTTQMLRLEDFASNPSPLAKPAGGIRVQYTGQPGSVLVTGGLENDSEGYSANIPFWMRDMHSSSPGQMTYASAGVMVGKPDPMMMPGFPKDTTFSPYLVLRNTTEKPLDVSLQLNYMISMSGSATDMGGNAPVKRNLPAQHLAPFEARQVDMQSSLNSTGVKNFSGSINLSASFTGKAGDLVLASGSVDQTGSYVFEVEPQGVASSRSKYANYWGVANGNDTMFSLWNPTDAAQDILATFYYGDGSGKYTLPVHLEAQASTMIDMAMLITEIKPDASGNVIPSNIQEGSAQFVSAKGRNESITLVIAAGIYNVTNATCGGGCITCCGDSNFGISPNPIYCPIGETMPCSSTAVDCYGNTVFPSSWSSSNTAVMTVDGSGTVTGVSVGSATINAYFDNVVMYTGQICGGPIFCPTGSMTPGASANVTPKILLGGSNGTDITNTTQNVVTGQQIVLYGSYTLPSGYTFSSQSWTVPGTGSTPPTAIHNFTYASDFSSGGPVVLTSDQLSQQLITYYWVTPSSGSNAATFTLNYVDSQGHSQSSPATASFNVAGPTSVQIVLVALGTPQILSNGTTGAQVEFGDPSGTPGIQWSGSATSPSQVAGTYEWAQILTNNSYSYTVGATTTSCNGPMGLDNQFPLVQGLSFNDSPKRGLPPADNEFTWTWSATTYFMWNPGLTGSIRVPIGQRIWQFFSDTAQNMSTNVWTVQSDSSSTAGAPQIGYFPIQWNSLAQNNSLGGCQ